ncbi:MAG: hypothetical protein RMJ56_10735 [Gemmataceae bacterium]|nr:hypothetical protein [Gemmata sp.]MDW8198065.1 hypothetical protein [Gemmataceae bacterium]
MADSLWMPWRWVTLPRIITAVLLLIGLPLFLRMPPWCDVTLYQLAARNILHGGIHYQDVFDTNLPGYVWIITGLYAFFGASAVAVRVMDVVVVTGVVLLLDRLAQRGGATVAMRGWTIATATLFYLFAVEMAHAQRDTWMALPALAAVLLRVRRAGGTYEPTAGGHFRAAITEGLLWGAAVWLKPHVILMAAAVWLLSIRYLCGGGWSGRRGLIGDFLGNLVGGGVVGLAGIGWLVASGAGPAFVEVFTRWNPKYLELVRLEFDDRVAQELFWFPPWSLGLVLTVPLAIAAVLDAAPWRSRATALTVPGPLSRWLPWWLWDTTASAEARWVRGILAGFYLVWAAQAFFLQRGFQYVHVVETLLMFSLWAAHRWAWVLLGWGWLLLTSSVGLLADYSGLVKDQLEQLHQRDRQRYWPRHPLFRPERLALWPQCWRCDLSDAERWALWDQLRLHPPHEAAISWQELGEVAAFLRQQRVTDREVIAWFDSPHAVYLLLDIEPGFRFMHVYTALTIASRGVRTANGQCPVLAALSQQHQARFVVNDLEWSALFYERDPEQVAALRGPARHPPHDLLPAFTPHETLFPFNQPTLFRSRHGTGRYIVHQLVTRGDGPPVQRSTAPD